jgi:hypothetical protein
MPTYQIGDATFRRKHLYMPCIMNLAEQRQDLTPEELVALYKACYWEDFITKAEWPVVLGHDVSAKTLKTNKYRLKRKAVGWLISLGRIAHINPKLSDEIIEDARKLYQEQIQREWPWGETVGELVGLTPTEERDADGCDAWSVEVRYVREYDGYTHHEIDVYVNRDDGSVYRRQDGEWVLMWDPTEDHDT